MTHRLTRRSLLLGTSTLALGSLLSGCGLRGPSGLRIYLLRGSIPPQLPGDFRENLNPPARLDFVSTPQLTDLFRRLQTWGSQPASENPASASPAPSGIADLVTLGDFWLAQAIQQKLIQPMSLTDLSGWNQLGTTWQELVRRNNQGVPDPNGQIWAAPYRWGSVAIAYRKDKLKPLGWKPTHWDDLWRPELKGQISLLDSPRTVIGIALKKLGRSVNTDNLDAIPDLVPTLEALHQQTRFYSSDAYLQPLILGDTWMVMGWSTDLLPIARRDARIGTIVPEPGTILFADLWVRPSKAASATGTAPLFAEWIDFCWNPDSALQLSLLSNASSPIVTNLDRTTLPAGIESNPLLLPPSETFQNSEFLLPIPATTVEQYRQLWVRLRSPASSSIGQIY